MKTKIAVLVSGGGTNLQALIDSQTRGELCSGEIALAFTTGNKLAHYSSDRLESIRLVYEEDIDEVFRAAIESVDEAIISSMLHAKAVTGRAGNHYKSLADLYMTEKKSEK